MMRDILDKEVELRFKIDNFRTELYQKISETDTNKDFELRFELYKLELTLERAICIIALKDAVKEYIKAGSDFKNIKATNKLCDTVTKCSNELFALLGEEIDLIGEKGF